MCPECLEFRERREPMDCLDFLVPMDKTECLEEMEREEWMDSLASPDFMASPE